MASQKNGGLVVGVGFVILVIISVWFIARQVQKSSELDLTGLTVENTGTRAATEERPACVQVTGAGLQVNSSNDFLQHSIVLNETLVKVIDVSDFDWPESKASILLKTSCYAYIAVDPTGLGGYILYGGHYKLYRLTLATGEVENISYPGDWFTNISSDELLLASVGSGNIYVTNLFSGQTQTFTTDSSFDEIGDAIFSPDGTKLAYAAAMKQDEDTPTESGKVYIIDLLTGEQSLSDIELPDAAAPQIKSWNDNKTLILE